VRAGGRKALLALTLAILVLTIGLWCVASKRSTKESDESSTAPSGQQGVVGALEVPAKDASTEATRSPVSPDPATSAETGSTFYYVRVVDAAGKPVSGARVSSCSNPNFLAFRPASTDGSGGAAISILAKPDEVDDLLWEAWERGQGLRIDAAGFSPALVNVEPGRTDPSSPQEFRLSAGAAFTVIVRSARGDGIGGVSVHLSSAAMHLLQTTAPPLILPKKFSNITRGSGGSRSSTGECNQDFEWIHTTNEGGVAEFADLPPRCSLYLLLSGEHHVGWKESIAVEFVAGERRTLELTFGTASYWTGVLLDESDQPIPEARVGLIGADAFSAHRYLSADIHCLDVAVTDAAGWVLHTQRGTYISGTVVDSTGDPVADARVLARPKNGSGSLRVWADSQGRFTLGPLFPEPFLVRAWKDQHASVPETTEIVGGDSGELLRLK